MTVAQATNDTQWAISPATLFRLGGLALMLALPVQIAGWIIQPASEDLPNLLSSLNTPAHLLQFASWILVLLGLPALYARQAHRAGVLGLVGTVLSVIIAALSCYLVLYQAVVAPVLAKEPGARALVVPGAPLAHGAFDAMGLGLPLLLVVFFISAPLFGFATLRAGVLPRAVGWLLIGSTVPNVLSVFLPDAPAGFPDWLWLVAVGAYMVFLGYAWGGYALWTQRTRVSRPVAHPNAPQPVA